MSDRGTSVAPVAWVRVLSAACLLTMGCLVTDEVEFPEEVACPPSIETSPTAPYPLNRIVRVDLDADAPDAGMGEVTFQATIRDCNEEQDLQYQAVLNYDPDFGGRAVVFADGTIQPSQRAAFTFRLPHTSLVSQGGAGRCHKAELLVTTRFGFGSRALEPETPGDLGAAVWWLQVTDETNPAVDMETCP